MKSLKGNLCPPLGAGSSSHACSYSVSSSDTHSMLAHVAATVPWKALEAWSYQASHSGSSSANVSKHETVWGGKSTTKA